MHLFPFTVRWLQNAPDEETAKRRHTFIEKALRNTDERVAADKPITPMFLFAVLLGGWRRKFGGTMIFILRLKIALTPIHAMDARKV